MKPCARINVMDILASYEVIGHRFAELCDVFIYHENDRYYAYFNDWPDIVCMSTKRHMLEKTVTKIIKMMYAQEGQNTTVRFYDAVLDINSI